MFKYRVRQLWNVFFMEFLFVSMVLFQISLSLLNVKHPGDALVLGQNLTMRLTNSPSGKKEDIINDLTDYYILLNTAFRVENNSFPRGKQTLRELKNLGGPPFLKVEIKEELLRNRYDMEDVEIDHVKEVVEDIDRLWRDIKFESV